MPMTPAQEDLVFFHTLGKSLSIWADIEMTLMLIVSSSLSSDLESRALFVAGYSKIDGFRTKLNFAHGTISRKLIGGPYIEDWNAQRRKLDSQVAMRNKLAHSISFMYGHAKAGRRCALCPGWSPAVSLDVDGPPPGAIYLVDLIKIEQQFGALLASLSNFYSRICEKPERYSKAAETPGVPPTLEVILKSVYAAAQPPASKSA